MKKSILILAAFASIGFATAAPMDGAPSADCDGVKVATGPKGKGYSAMFADVKKVCGSKVAMCEVNTGGGLDNADALKTKEADVGFMQVDTWADRKNGDDDIAALQAVKILNNNYLHVIVAANGFSTVGEKKFGFLKGDAKTTVINRVSELRGQTVALVGTAKILVRRIDQQQGLKMNMLDARDDAQAFAMVKSGQAAAAFTVAGWPSGPVKNLTQADGLTMVPYDLVASEPFKIKQLSYKGIATYNVNSLAVQNVILTRPFSGPRKAAVAALQTCINQNMVELKEGNYQPGWNEVSDSATSQIPAFKK